MSDRDFGGIVDAWLKGGWPYMQANGVAAFVYWGCGNTGVLGRSPSINIRSHTFMAIVVCVSQFIAVFEVFPKLGF